MSIPLTGSGSLFVRLGHLFGDFLDINALRGSSIATARVLSGANLQTRMIGTVQPDYNNGTAIPQVISGLQSDLAAAQQGMGTFLANFQTYAQNTLKTMYGIDRLGMPSNAPLSEFAALDLGTAVIELIRQMKGASASIQQATVSAGSQTAVGTPVGNAIIVASLKNGQGITVMLPFPETLLFRCTADSYTGGTAVGNETLTVTGDNAVTDPLSQLYPSGMGVGGVGLSCVDGASDESTGNLLRNSDFETFTTADYPDNWIILAGLAGTTIFDATSSSYLTGGGAVRFLGDSGGTLCSIAQTFGATPSTTAGAGGSSQSLVANQVYHVNGFVKVSAAPSTGVLQVCLLNGSNAIIADDAGNNLAFTVDLTAQTTSYAAFNGSFSLPKSLPSTVKLAVRLSTAIDDGKSAYLADVSMARASDAAGNGLYAGGPFITVHSGSIALVDGMTPDAWTIAIANSYETTGSGLMQLMLDRVWGLRSLGSPALQLPVAGSPTVADSLIA